MTWRPVNELRRRHLERQAVSWVVRIDEDRGRHEAGLRRWVGGSSDRAELYNRAYRAFHEAGTAARQIYGLQVHRKSSDVPLAARLTYRYLAVIIGLSLLVAAAGSRITLGLLNDAAAMRTGAADTSATYVTRTGEVRTIRLGDGSSIILDTDSLVRVAFDKDARKVLLDHGRARFEVAHDPDWPFVVTAGGGTVTARGTVFDVEAYKIVEVRLISGSVDVRYPQIVGKPTAAAVHLASGQQLRFDPAMAEAPGAPSATPRSDTQWVSGMKTFDDVPVGDILEEVNRYSTTKIVLADPELATHRVFLDLDIRNPQQAAANLALYLELEIDRTQPGSLILLAPAPK